MRALRYVSRDSAGASVPATPGGAPAVSLSIASGTGRQRTAPLRRGRFALGGRCMGQFPYGGACAVPQELRSARRVLAKFPTACPLVWHARVIRLSLQRAQPAGRPRPALSGRGRSVSIGSRCAQVEGLEADQDVGRRPRRYSPRSSGRCRWRWLAAGSRWCSSSYVRSGPRPRRQGER